MNITVIGGSGFIGSFLMQELSNNEVINIDKNPSPFFQSKTKIIDIRKKKKLIFNSNIDFVVLLAAEHRDDVSPTSLYYDVNVKGTQNVLDSMDKAGIKNLIFTSSVAVYGLNKKNPNESHNVDPFNHYGKSKWEAEKIIKKWYEADPSNKSITIIRPTVVFGERNRGNVYNLLKQISTGKFLMVGKGQNKKSMAYVGNIVALIKDRLEKAEAGYEVYNYVDKPDFSMTDLTQIIEKKMNIKLPKLIIPYWLGMIVGHGFDLLSLISKKKLPISSVRVKKFCVTTQFDASKVQNVFTAPFSLKEGLEKTLEHEFINPNEDEFLFYSE